MKTNGHLKIEKGIPVPEGHGNHRGYAQVLRAMKEGESVLLPVKSYAGAWQHACKAMGKGNFIVRADGKGFRVWRRGVLAHSS